MTKIWEAFRTNPYPMWLSALALSLGIGPSGARFLGTLKLAGYDPTVAVLTATLIALIWAANYAYLAVKRSEFEFERTEAARAHARLAILGSISAELGHIKNALDVVATPSYAVSATQWLSTPQLSQALTTTDLLKPGEAHRLTLLLNAIRAIVSSHELVKAVEASSIMTGSDLDFAKMTMKQHCEGVKIASDEMIRYVDKVFSVAGLPDPRTSE